jgi:hypothetical protein
MIGGVAIRKRRYSAMIFQGLLGRALDPSGVAPSLFDVTWLGIASRG